MYIIINAIFVRLSLILEVFDEILEVSLDHAKVSIYLIHLHVQNLKLIELREEW